MRRCGVPLAFARKMPHNLLMEASAVSRTAPAGAIGILAPRMLGMASDARLVAWVREGRAAAFEALYERHRRAILSFCHQMLGSHEEAEDATQHTFLAAYNGLVRSDGPIHLRAWLFTIARNRCCSVLRKRREQPLATLAEPESEDLARLVQRRQDLCELVRDMRRLPDEQRAAPVLAEMDALSHEQIGAVLGVPTPKVKALVFQAREPLLASRSAREADCAEIREQLANLRGGALRRTRLRRHLRDCPGCREFRRQLDRQRRQLRLLIPVAPSLAIKKVLLPAATGGASAGGGIWAFSGLKGATVVGAVLAGVGVVGTVVATDWLVPAGPAHPVRAHARAHHAAHLAGGRAAAGTSVLPGVGVPGTVPLRPHRASALGPPALLGSHRLIASFGHGPGGDSSRLDGSSGLAVHGVTVRTQPPTSSPGAEGSSQDPAGVRGLTTVGTVAEKRMSPGQPVPSLTDQRRTPAWRNPHARWPARSSR